MIKRLMDKRRLFAEALIFILIFAGLSSSNVSAAKPDRRAPSAPGNLMASFLTDTSVSLAWDASTDNVGVESYNVYEDNVMVGNTSAAAYNVGSLIPETTYEFYVRAKDTVGNVSNTSNTLTVTTSKAEPEAAPALATNPDPAPDSVPEAKVIGYYAAWAAYSGFTPDKIDAGKLTHINYAFANIGSNLKIALGYPDVDPSNMNKLKALKRAHPKLKTLIAVGGWSWSGRFSDAALTEASRTAFADSCVDFIVKYGFDGIDIDWEYPTGGGLPSNVSRPADKHNFTLLMQKLRERLDARGKMDGRHYILTFAGAAGREYVNNTELGDLHRYVDYGEIMTYDLHGIWDNYTDFNAPLYSSSDASPQYKLSVDEGIHRWLQAGFPVEKLVMGVPFYGYKYDTTASAGEGLYQPFSGGAAISYGDIAAYYLKASGYVRHFQSESKVPWLFNGSTFISYDDPQSMGLKARYIKSEGLGGAMVWELSQDPKGVLLKALYNSLK